MRKRLPEDNRGFWFSFIPGYVWKILVLTNCFLAVASISLGIYNLAVVNAMSAIACAIGAKLSDV
tara:strand:- start:1126 stop:1320 length:195 start_codon:yes stop_codon:yes gene_type:complete